MRPRGSPRRPSRASLRLLAIDENETHVHPHARRRRDAFPRLSFFRERRSSEPRRAYAALTPRRDVSPYALSTRRKKTPLLRVTRDPRDVEEKILSTPSRAREKLPGGQGGGGENSPRGTGGIEENRNRGYKWRVKTCLLRGHREDSSPRGSSRIRGLRSEGVSSLANG